MKEHISSGLMLTLKSFRPLSFIVFLFSLQTPAFAQNCGAYSVEYIPFSYQIEGIIGQDLFEKNVACNFNLTSCSIDEIFNTTKNLSGDYSKSIRVRISKKDSPKYIIVTDKTEIVIDQKISSADKIIKKSVLEEVKDKGDRCTAEKKYSALCARRSGQSKRMKDLCNSLKNGVLPPKTKKEVVK